MKRLTNAWQQVVSFDNLYMAYKKARKAKQSRPEVAAFGFDLERQLLELQEQLKNRSYKPGSYRQFEIYDRKARLISAAPFRDRVVHHALMNVLEPYMDKRMYSHSYACRQGKGVHCAVRQYQAWSGKYAYVLGMDILQYFASVDHQRLKQKIKHWVKDKQVLWLCDVIIDYSPNSQKPALIFPGDDCVDVMQRRAGLPIGNLTSQVFANLYLTEMDYFIKQSCRGKAYLRYVDDLIVLGYSKDELWDINQKLAQFLTKERLKLHPHKTQLQATSTPLNVLGYRVGRHRVRLRQDNGYRFRRRLKQLSTLYARGEINLADIDQSVAAWIGHVQHADSYGLRKAVLSGVNFKRGAASI